MSPEDNSAKYRKRLSQAHPPIIPFLGIHLGDLIYLHEAKRKELSRNDFESARRRESQSATVIDRLLQWQATCGYTFSERAGVQALLNQEHYIKELQSFVENQHYIQSLSLEPKAGVITDAGPIGLSRGSSSLVPSNSISDILTGDDAAVMSHTRSTSLVHSRQTSGGGAGTGTPLSRSHGHQVSSSSDSNHSATSLGNTVVTGSTSHPSIAHASTAPNTGTTSASWTPRSQKSSFLARFRLSTDASSLSNSTSNSNNAASGTQNNQVSERPVSPDSMRKSINGVVPILSYTQHQSNQQQTHPITKASATVSPTTTTHVLSTSVTTNTGSNPTTSSQSSPISANSSSVIMEGMLCMKHRLLPNGQKNPKRPWTDGWFRLYPNGQLMGYSRQDTKKENEQEEHSDKNNAKNNASRGLPWCLYELRMGDKVEIPSEYQPELQSSSVYRGGTHNSNKLSRKKKINPSSFPISLLLKDQGQILLQCSNREQWIEWLTVFQQRVQLVSSDTIVEQMMS